MNMRALARKIVSPFYTMKDDGHAMSDERYWSTWTPLGPTGSTAPALSEMQRKVGDGMGLDLLMIPVLWIASRMMESPIGVTKDGDDDIDMSHALARLLRHPNPWYSGSTMVMAATINYCMDGNAYLLKIKDARGKDTALVFLPSWTVEPLAPVGGQGYVDEYLYNPGGIAMGDQSRTTKIPASSIIHWRFGIDPNNTRKGISRVKIALRRAYTDVEAANMTVMLLKNAGLMGIIVSPKLGTVLQKPKETKEYIIEEFRGAKQGDPIVFSAPTDVNYMGADASKMDLSALMDVGEERWCALLNVASAVVGFGTGMQQTKVGATLESLRLMSFEDCIIPAQNQLCDELDLQLMPDFETEPERFHCQHDNSKVRVLQEDENKRSDRLTRQLTAGGITLEKYHDELGYESKPQEAVYYLPGFAQVVREEDLGKEPPAPKAPPADGQTIDGQAVDEQAQAKLREQATLFKSTIVSMRRDAGGIKAQLASRLSRLVHKLARDQRRLRAEWEPKLAESFRIFGGKVAAHVLAAAERRAKAASGGFDDAESPWFKIDWAVVADEGLQEAWVDKVLSAIQSSYREQFLAVARATFEGIDAELGFGVMLDDYMQSAIYKTAGRRMGLIDLEEDTRRALFDAIEQARAEGLGVQQMASRIEELVSAGPWSSSYTRAQVIARTETAYAQNYSSLEAYRSAGVTRIMIFDAQMGPTDAECEALDQTEVSLEQAMRLMESEHPNGTRSFAPVMD
jgi:HK97 family phage portal protein